MHHRIYFISIIAMLAMAGCSDRTDTPEPKVEQEVQELKFTINHQINGEAITWFDQNYELPSGTQVQLTRMAYILSEFYLLQNGGDTVFLSDQYALIDARLGPWSVTLTDVPMGDYSGIGFSLGLLPEINHADPNQYPVTHVLSPVKNSLHWSWTAGYIFIALEGRTPSDNESFLYHIAGDQNRVDYSLPLNFSKKRPALTATLQCDYENIFQNPAVFDPPTDGMSTHSTTDAVTQALVANMHDMFSLKSVE